MKKIALIGRIASGKDTVAAFLCEHYGFKRYAFGDEIRDVCWRLFPERMTAANGKDRRLLQEVGQFMRRFDENVWVKATLQRVYAENLSFGALSKNIVISDVRQPNEFSHLRELGFTMVRVTARDEVRLERLKERGDVYRPEDLSHETESYVDHFEVDYEIENSGSLVSLAEQVRAIMIEEEGHHDNRST